MPDLKDPYDVAFLIVMVIGMAVAAYGFFRSRVIWKPFGRFPTFQPVAWYDEAMDQLNFLTEDVSYRADRVDDYISILWHPSEWNVVGLQIQGFSEWVRLSRVQEPLHLGLLLKRIHDSFDQILPPHTDTLRLYRTLMGLFDGVMIPTKEWKKALAPLTA
jgi:hypothetical protein